MAKLTAAFATSTVSTTVDFIVFTAVCGVEILTLFMVSATISIAAFFHVSSGGTLKLLISDVNSPVV